MELPKSIKEKLRRYDKYARLHKQVRAEIIEWFEKNGVDMGEDSPVNDQLLEYGYAQTEESIEKFIKMVENEEIA